MRTDYYVYYWQNLVNGKGYVGKGRRDRATAHLEPSSGSRLYYAFRKYGVENFKLTYLATNLREDFAFWLECFYIRELKTKKRNGYNLTDGGEGASGCPEAPEKTARRAATLRALWANNEDAKKAASARSLLYWTDGAKEAKAAKERGKRHTEETKAKMAAAHGPGSQKHPKGSEHGRAVLTESLVREYRERHAKGGVSYAELALECGATPVAVSLAIRRKTWTHVL